LPAVLTQTPKSFYAGTNRTLAEHARIFYERLAKVPGLRPFRPQAGWFMLVELVQGYFAEKTQDLIELLKVEQRWVLWEWTGVFKIWQKRQANGKIFIYLKIIVTLPNEYN
jgi:aspartate/methionine/tyrosine aminotransferase